MNKGLDNKELMLFSGLVIKANYQQLSLMEDHIFKAKQERRLRGVKVW